MIKGEPIIILLVEDDPAHAEIVRRNLEQSRVANKIIHVSDGQDALDYFFDSTAGQTRCVVERPHLILLDLRLPKVDGLEVLQQLKTNSDTRNIPVVVLTTSQAEIDLAKAYEYHANSYLVKPVDFSKFMELMEAFGYYWFVWNQFPI
jgi:CheY-like chemotaxis protein